MLSSSSRMNDNLHRDVIYALDFDGVLVDSAAETAQSGWRGCRILMPHADWLQKKNDNDNNSSQSQLSALIEAFVKVRPVLYVGWEAIVMVQLLLDPVLGLPSVDDILKNFHYGDGGCGLKAKAMKHAGFSENVYHTAMKEARYGWIAENHGQDWIAAHDFFGGACDAVRTFLQSSSPNHVRSDRLFVITTKAKDFALRLLEQQGLYDTKNPTDPSKIQEAHIFGLGSGPKAAVLQKILEEHDGRRVPAENDEDAPPPRPIAIMVEDNVATLEKIMASPIGDRVLPVVASWGYNTPDQLDVASNYGYVMLSEEDSGSLQTVLDSSRVQALYVKMSINEETASKKS